MTVQLDSQQLFHYSHRRGLVIFLYGLIWLVATTVGYLLIDPLFGAGENLVLGLIVATWSAALAGGMGGATAMLSRLYRHISIEQDFQHHSLALYFIQPFSGLVVGILSLYLISLPGALLVNLVASPGAGVTDIFTSPAFIALQILLAWIAGFHQEIGLKQLKKAGQRYYGPLVPKPEFGNEREVIPAGPGVQSERAATGEADPLLFREWYRQQQQVRRWSFSWGVFILGYGLFCLIGLLLSTIIVIRLLPGSESSRHIASNLILAAWPVAIAGGMGGVLSMLRNLYQHISVERDFDRQHLMSYLVQPVLGAAFGLAISFLVSTGFLSLSSLRNEAAPQVKDVPVLIMIQLVLGWIAGFRNQFVADLINQVIDRIVGFVKLVGKLLHPKSLFNKDKRNAILAEIRNQAGFFKVSSSLAARTEEEEIGSDRLVR